MPYLCILDSRKEFPRTFIVCQGIIFEKNVYWSVLHLMQDDDDDWCFMATFVHMVGRATSKGNERKLKMKHPSDMPTLRLELGW